ncbi:MAG: hypothetical protein GY750_07615 [Lentisphaerae bacterium]|nr:hypothetical protein [Lentisphaerota bacterium]MCP4101275.1 hypothetical protein [Lentisphaerota bacterium]
MLILEREGGLYLDVTWLNDHSSPSANFKSNDESF